MRHSPHEYFLRFLCTRPGTTADEVGEFSASIGFGVLPYDTYIQDLFAEVTAKTPPNYNPKDRLHRPSRRFLRQMRVHGMWHPSLAVNEAMAMFKIRPVREVVNALIIQGRTDNEIAQILERWQGITVLPASVREYKHFFWNPDLMSLEDWAEVLDQVRVSTIEATALHAPRGLDGTRMILWKVGIRPRVMDKIEILTTVRDVAYMNFLEGCGQEQGVKKARMLRAYSRIVSRTQQKLDEYGSGEHTVIEDFHRHVRIWGRGRKRRTTRDFRTGGDVAPQELAMTG